MSRPWLVSLLCLSVLSLSLVQLTRARGELRGNEALTRIVFQKEPAEVLMAHVIESVEAIMKRPYGCGEQTIPSTYPSLLLLRQHKQSGGDFPLRARAQGYLKDG